MEVVCSVSTQSSDSFFRRARRMAHENGGIMTRIIRTHLFLLLTSAALALPALGTNQTLHDAAYWGSIYDVHRLLREGVNVNATVDGQTPLACAAQDGCDQKIGALLRAGADPNACQEGRTLLQAAAQRGPREAVRTLLAIGAEMETE